MNVPAPAIQNDANKNRMMLIYLATLCAVGIGLVAANAAFEVGGWVYGLGGFLVVAGLGGLAGMNKGGGFGVAPCPGCGAELSFQLTNQFRTMECNCCGTWSEGNETMTTVPDDRVADHCAFTVNMPDECVRWPGGDRPVCPVCHDPAVRMDKIEGCDALGTTAALLSPIAVQRVRSIEAPRCAQHTDGVALFVAGSKVTLGFRSRAYHLEFCQLNG